VPLRALVSPWFNITLSEAKKQSALLDKAEIKSAFAQVDAVFHIGFQAGKEVGPALGVAL